MAEIIKTKSSQSVWLMLMNESFTPDQIYRLMEENMRTNENDGKFVVLFPAQDIKMENVMGKIKNSTIPGGEIRKNCVYKYKRDMCVCVYMEGISRNNSQSIGLWIYGHAFPTKLLMSNLYHFDIFWEESVCL